MKVHSGTDWFWYQLGPHEKAEAKKMIHHNHWPQCEKWFEHENHINFLRADTNDQNNEAVFGSLIYHQGLDDEKNHTVFHFYITRDFFFTINFDFSLLRGVKEKHATQQIQTCENPIEGFFVLLGELMNSYLIGLDEFEVKQRTLKWQIHDDNSKGILENVHKLRHELFIWKGLILGAKKVEMALKEAFLPKNDRQKDYLRAHQKMERGITYINEFDQELSNLLHAEEVITSQRGNEIVKALTIFTTLFTPMTALGALWGMNFDNMPELHWKYSYICSILIIIVSTLLIYIYLRQKGWTGDILRENQKKYLRKEKKR
ncbi:magnesium transporter CorA family protein [Bacillus siamensis]|uniref:magnesium transporter CorA family protein n=1 Tax=Bacillus siamensis TaxID=659243 RepID=UPI003F66CD02